MWSNGQQDIMRAPALNVADIKTSHHKTTITVDLQECKLPETSLLDRNTSLSRSPTPEGKRRDWALSMHRGTWREKLATLN